MFTIAFISNEILNVGHFEAADAGETEKSVYASFSSKKEAVLADVMAQLSDSGAPAYKDCDEDMQHISVILSVLYLPRMQQSFRKIRLIPMILPILRGKMMRASVSILI